MKRIKCLQIMLLFFLIFIICGCADKYSETNVVAETTWKKMTIKEKTFYDKVEGVWGDDSLANVREVVRKREFAPDEDAIPFIDIVDLIVTNNDINLVTQANLNTNQKKYYTDGKWENIDTDWYKTIFINSKKAGPGNNFRSLKSQENRSDKSLRQSDLMNAQSDLPTKKMIADPAFEGSSEIIAVENFQKMS